MVIKAESDWNEIDRFCTRKNVSAPRVFLSDATYIGSENGRIKIDYGGRVDEFNHKFIEGVYDSNGKAIWKNKDYSDHKPASAPDYIKGLQIAFSDKVRYDGMAFQGHHLTAGNCDRHQHIPNKEAGIIRAGFDYSCSMIKAIFDRESKSVWEHWDLENLSSKEN
jgi:hypothetical protein